MDFQTLIKYVIITLVALFIAGPVIMNTIGKFGVQRRFAILMVQEGVITEETVKKTQKAQQMIGLVLSILLVAILVSMGIRNGLYGWLCIAAGLLVGAFRARRAVQYTSATVQSFKRMYVDQFDKEKLNEFVDKNF